jgi:hypothetical membrane protein
MKTQSKKIQLPLVGPALFIVTALIFGAVEPNYSPVHNTISELAISRHGFIQTLNFIICGTLISTLGVQLFRLKSSLKGSQYAGLAIALMGMVLLLSAFFVTDPLHIASTTLHGTIHNSLFLVGILGMVSAQVVVGIKNLKSSYGIYSLVSGIASFAGLIGVGAMTDMPGVPQRLLVILIMTWMTITFLQANSRGSGK